MLGYKLKNFYKNFLVIIKLTTKFPTTDEFNKQIENHINNQSNNTKRILKWRELPTGVIYKIKEAEKFKTAYGLSTNVTLKSKDDKKIKSFTTSCLQQDLQDFSVDKDWYIRSTGLKKSINNYDHYHYQLIKYPIESSDC